MGVSECLSVLRKTLEFAVSEDFTSPPYYMEGDIEEKCILPKDIPQGLKEDALGVLEKLSKWSFDNSMLYNRCYVSQEECPSLYSACIQPSRRDEYEFVNFLRNVLERWSGYE